MLDKDVRTLKKPDNRPQYTGLEEERICLFMLKNKVDRRTAREYLIDQGKIKVR